MSVNDIEKNLIEVDPRQANPEPLPDYPSDGEDPPATTPPAAQPIPTIAEADISQQSRISAPINVSDDKKNSGGRTISIAQCDTGEIGYELKVPAVLYKDGMDSSDNSTHKFFTKALVRSYVKQPVEDVKNNVCPNSQAFLISGGGEYIIAGTKSPNDEFIGSSKLLVKRVANWFMIQGHGSEEPTDNAIGEKGKNSVQPSDIYYRSSSGKCYSFYEGMDVLILDTCYNLCNHKFRGWRKVLPKGVILGYHGEVLFLRMDQVLDKLMEKLKSNPNMTQAEIGQAWADVNKDVYDNANWKPKGPWSYGYILPHPTDPQKNIYYSGAITLNTDNEKLICVKNPPDEL